MRRRYRQITLSVDEKWEENENDSGERKILRKRERVEERRKMERDEEVKR